MTFDSSKLKIIIVAIVALFASLYLGIAAATAQLEAIAWVAGGLGLVICLAMGRSIWLLVPLTSVLSLTFYYLPGMPETALLGQLAFVLFTTILFLMRRLIIRFVVTELEIWCFLLLLCVVQVYLRNPVGFSAIGTSNVGGKPYFNFAIAIMTALGLAVITVPPKELKWFVRLTMIGSILTTFVGIVGAFSPRLGYWIGSSSGQGLSGEEFDQSGVDSGAADRKGYLSPMSTAISRWVGSVRNPIMACLHPLYGTLVLISLAAAALSGFRNQIAVVGLTYLVAQFYRGGFKSVVLCMFIGATGVLMLSIGNMISPLPPNVQRVMTIFPGSWEKRYKDDAKGSTEWRVEMWIEALTNKRYIANTFIGDGLGMSAAQLEQSQVLAEKKARGMSGWDLHRETVMINGDFHSGPVQTIKTIGYVGLLVLVMGMFRLAVHAHRQIQRCRGTEWFSTALFFGIPLIWGPVYFVFIFGSFSAGSVSFLLGCGFLRILEKSLPLPAYAPLRRRDIIPQGLASRKTMERPVA